eukprot:2533012-Lingulodinium_polyedra.AAC.1
MALLHPGTSWSPPLTQGHSCRFAALGNTPTSPPRECSGCASRCRLRRPPGPRSATHRASWL